MAAVVVCLATAGRAGAGYDEGMQAFADGDYDTAYRELRPLAEKGEPGAQFTLGFMYDYGQGVPQNTQEAIWWYRNAAEQDIAVAQFSLGEIYEGGRGTPQDLAEAYRWYSLAVENLSPGEIRDDVVERRDALAGKLTAEQIAVVAALLSGKRGERQAREARTAETAPGTPGGAQDAALVAAIQGELARLGYELDWRLGSLDRLTRGAIQAFEIESGREITGLASDALLAALRATERPGMPAADEATVAKDADAVQNDLAPEAPGKGRLTAKAAADESETVAAETALAGESAVEVPSGAAGGPLIPLRDESDATHQQDEAQHETTQQAALPESAQDQSATHGSNGVGWDLQFVERQIERLDAITARVDGPSAAVPGWDSLEAWEIETRGLLAARLGREMAEGLTEKRQTLIVGDPYGNFHHTSAAYRGYLSALLSGL